MILVVLLRYTQPQATRSISFKLSFWIGLSDALYRSFYIIYVASDFLDEVIPNNLWLGRIIFWSFHFFPIWFSLLTVSIAFDLQLSAFHNKLTVQRSFFSNRNFQSPVKESLLDGAIVLDVGCGPGIWTMEMATEYPRSQFHGIDICDMFPQQIRPANCHFQIADILKRLPFEDAQFDFIYIRCMSLAVFQSEWPDVISEIFRIIKPGGYLEFVEAVYNTLRARDTHPSWACRIGEYLRFIGTEDVNSFSHPITVSSQSGEDVSCGKDYWMHFLRAIKPHLAQVMYISPEEYDELQQCVYRELSADNIRIDVVSTYGWKPFKIIQVREDDEQIDTFSG
ncbi:uncharacterized protein VTP21DRAFT_6132 [Calcarisporiella thermophila]|uniref:uncharacterized protein n=1 Tax=Calcarisporiella thermophila TaxID=911321 RepID=UPI0037446F70